MTAREKNSSGGTRAMLRRLLWVLPLVLVTGLLATGGLRLGSSWAALDESDVISHFARRYVEEVPGADAADCTGRPGVGRAWVVVSCGPKPFDAERHRTWRIDRLGRVIGATEDGFPPEGI